MIITLLCITMIDTKEEQEFVKAKELRNKERQDKAPLCKPCNVTTYYDTDCHDYVCVGCGTHYSQSGSKMRFCIQCSWNKSNFSELDAGERWDEEY